MQSSKVKETGRIALELGFVPILVRIDAKIPLMKGWLGTTKESAEGTFQRSKSPHNVGIITGEKSGVIVIDVEREDLDEWDQLLKEQHAKLDTLTISSGNGGVHVYFKYKPSLSDIRNGVKIKLPLKNGEFSHVDIRTNGAQAMFINSIHPKSHKKYVPIGGWHEHPEEDAIDVNIEDMPDWLVEDIRSAQSKIGKRR
jgi:hypothetical protein